MQKIFYILVFLVALAACRQPVSQQQVERIADFNKDWQFSKTKTTDLYKTSDTTGWEKVSIPHTANIEPWVIIGDQWQGDCVYRKIFSVSPEKKDKHLALKFEGAMMNAEVFVNGTHVASHKGGYLPFYVELSGVISYENPNVLVVKLNNEDDLQTPPGKTLKTLDFSIYSGIYRNVWLIEKDKLHISDAIQANKVAGGGVFVSYPTVSKEKAQVNVKVDVENEYTASKSAEVEAELYYEGKLVQKTKSMAKQVPASQSAVYELSLNVEKPELWHPNSPSLYNLKVKVIEGAKTVDTEELKIGIRTIAFSAKEGFKINGEKFYMRGTNRHQEYPYVGYALSDNANRRDAYKIRKAGFNFVRFSHYPQSKSFLNACDEYGILVMDAIPGWQFFGDSLFQTRAIEDTRNMVRRDRNHPSVVLWEASLNESQMDKQFMQRAHNAVHEEYPGTDTYTCGWMDDVYDLYIPARQHGKAPEYWKKYSKDKPIFIAEYGDWEYYAQNAGFNQTAFADLSEEERTSRQLRAHGQKRLAQQALNYQEAHNDNLYGPTTGDANWLMFDYNRGYSPDIEASGIMDIFRLPKFAFYFYQSQASVGETSIKDFSKPMVKIANYYNDASFLNVTVYSNCEEVELLVNGKSVEKRKPDTDANSTNLKHPPFTFPLASFEPGKLTVKGYIDGKVVCQDATQTPELPYSIQLSVDESGTVAAKGCNDILFVYATIVDKNGTQVPLATNQIEFAVSGDAELIGSNPMEAEAGIASILLKVGDTDGALQLTATSKGLEQSTLNFTVY